MVAKVQSATEAKKQVSEALDRHGIEHSGMTARWVSFEGLGYGGAFFVKVKGLDLPDPRISAVKADLKQSGAIMEPCLKTAHTPEGVVVAG